MYHTLSYHLASRRTLAEQIDFEFGCDASNFLDFFDLAFRETASIVPNAQRAKMLTQQKSWGDEIGIAVLASNRSFDS